MFAIISAEYYTYSVEKNEQRTNDLRDFLNNEYLDVTESIGVYRGTQELSFCVEIDSRDIADVIILASSYGQESIFIVNGSNANLMYVESGEIEGFNWFNGKLSDEAYTLIDGDYFTALPRTDRTGDFAVSYSM